MKSNFLTILRVDQNDHRSLGMIKIGGELVCFTLEPPWKNNDENVSCIPEGLYKYKKYQSAKFNRKCLALYNVVNRSYISVHNGCFPHNTKGCILVGNQVSHMQLFNSKQALKNLMYHIQDEGWILIRSI